MAMYPVDRRRLSAVMCTRVDSESGPWSCIQSATLTTCLRVSLWCPKRKEAGQETTTVLTARDHLRIILKIQCFHPTRAFRRAILQVLPFPNPCTTSPSHGRGATTTLCYLLDVLLEEQDPAQCAQFWWRLQINKLPSGLHLHSIISDVVEPLCRVCGVDLETNQHLLFSCPKKLEVWQSALSRYVEERA